MKAAETTAKSALDRTQTSVGALQKQVLDVQAKQDETSKAAIKAQAAERNIERAQSRMTDFQKNLRNLVETARDLAAKIEAAKQEADTAVAHIKGQLPRDVTGTETSAEDTHTGLAPDRAFTSLDLAALYKFPTQFNGAGQTIALIELGGGFREADLVGYFKSLGIPMPRVSTMSIGGAQNSPSGPNSADGQVELEIEVAGAVAPGAHIVVYFCPNTNSGFLQGINTAINNRDSPTSVLSISWGGPEPSWAAKFIQQMNTAFQSASLHGITVLAAAGDNGPNDGTSKPAVDFPSSSPWVTGVGGTHIHASATELQSEVAWDDGSARLRSDPYDPQRPSGRKGGGREGQSTASLHSRFVRCDKLNFRSSTSIFGSTTKLQTHPLRLVYFFQKRFSADPRLTLILFGSLKAGFCLFRGLIERCWHRQFSLFKVVLDAGLNR